MSRYYDVVITGGGASGLACSVIIKMHGEEISVCILEQLNRVGKKLITTGNGRCNITNRNAEPSKYHGENAGFCRYALKNYDNFATEVFFNQLGIIFTYDSEGRAYPYSLQASSVVDALRFAAEEKGVEIFTEHAVTDVFKNESGYTVTAGGEKFKTPVFIAAGGLYSGGEKAGSNGSMLKILEKLGYRTVKTTPAIVQIKTESALTRSLKGIKVNAKATLFCDGKPLRSETGEVLFCDYGLSGPPVMQISRETERKKGEKHIALDLMPEYDIQRVFDMIRYRKSVLSKRPLEEFFTGMLNKRVGQAIVKLSGLKLSDFSDTLTTDDIKRLAQNIKNLSFAVTGTAGFINSQVTAGGLDTSGFDDTTMMSEKDEGLFCIGEILDIDGDCGGYNLQWAWSSAMCAADAVCEYLDGGKK